MAQKFNCPSCGSTIEYVGSDPTVTCSYCNNNVPVPKELLQVVQEQQTTQAAKKWMRYLVIFLIITVQTTIKLPWGK